MKPALVDAAAARLIVDGVGRPRTKRDERADDEVEREPDDAGHYQAMPLLRIRRVARVIGDPREIETMKAQPGKDLVVFGSGSIVSQLTQRGLIDEYQFVVCPILLGSGRPLLSDVSKRLRLDLLEAKALPSGDVMLRYARPN